MILEVAFLYVKKDLEQDFEVDFKKASQYISSIDGYLKHSLQKCLEVENKYLLLVEWENLEAHTISFRESKVYQQLEMLHNNYEAFPIVEHFEIVYEQAKK